MFFFLTVPDPINVEKIDIVFAVSASSSQAKEIFQLMKDTLSSIVATHGAENIHYTIVSYGSQIRSFVNFQDNFGDEEGLLRILENLSPVGGTPDLDKTLEYAKSALEGPGSRADAKKFLVLLVDNKSGSTEEDVLKFAFLLEGGGIKVIPVGIGVAVDREELENTTPLKGNIIEVPEESKPENLGKKIIDKIRESKCRNFPSLEETSVLLDRTAETLLLLSSV